MSLSFLTHGGLFGHADDAGLWQCTLIMNSESDFYL